MRVVIVGVGGIGQELAENLMRSEANELVLIDADEERCEDLAEELDAIVLYGDGTNPEILKKGKVEEADALVATTSSDALNTVVAMLASRLGVEKIIVKLNGLGLRPACQEIGVTKIIAPKLAASTNILAALYGSDRLDLSLIGRGGLFLAEIEIQCDIDEKIGELEISDQAVFVAIRRGEEVILPKKSARLEEGDVAMLLVENEDVLEETKKHLEALQEE